MTLKKGGRKEGMRGEERGSKGGVREEIVDPECDAKLLPSLSATAGWNLSSPGPLA